MDGWMALSLNYNHRQSISTGADKFPYLVQFLQTKVCLWLLLPFAFLTRVETRDFVFRIFVKVSITQGVTPRIIDYVLCEYKDIICCEG
jgi:hypothetical protein